MSKSATKKIVTFLAALAASLTAFTLVHAQGLGQLGAEVGAQAGLGGGDPRMIIGRIIQVALGVLGAIALILILYAGFLWMTAGGNEEKVVTAKQILTQAVIGLAIILSAFAITSFILTRLLEATGATPGGPTGGGPPGGGFTSDQFTVTTINPPGSSDPSFEFPKNVKITIVFTNGSPDPTTVTPSTVSVSTGGNIIVGSVLTTGNTAVWSSSTPCEENGDYMCLPPDATINVDLSAAIRSLGGDLLTCGLCSATFHTGNYIDTEPPTVTITSPVQNQSVPMNSFVPIFSDPRDDSAVATVEYSANGASLGFVGTAPWQYDWSTEGITAGTTVGLGARATDVVGNTGTAPGVDVIVRPVHCFNNVRDADETGLDCGGSCGACPGDTCTTDADCFSGICENGRCVERPRIDSVSPLTGGPGTLVTIRGIGFGGTPGTVVFLGTDAEGDERSSPPCAPAAWTNNEVVVSVPDGAVSGPLELVTVSNGSDRTDDAFGNSSIPDFTVNTTVLPGICTIAPAVGAPGTEVLISGTGFGDSRGTSETVFANRPANILNWAAAQIRASVPNLLAGLWPVQVQVGGARSNGVAFTVPESASVPHILEVSPNAGPVGEYVTITGTNFGSNPGRVNFVRGLDTYVGKTDFPEVCGNAYWHDTSITVKVPPEGTLGSYDIRVVTSSGVASDNTMPFSETGGTPKPGLCRINPSAGPPGIPFTLYGERLGDLTGRVTFSNNKLVSSFSSWNQGEIKGAVASGTVTGPVTATENGGQTSNSVLFAVGSCKTSPSLCTGSDLCCDDGSCRAPNADGTSSCGPPHHDSAYVYRFSTGVIPLVPHVVEDVACEKVSQSPSPFLGTFDACVNAILSVRFDVGMNDATFNRNNFSVVACGSDDKFNAGNCGTTLLAGDVEPFGAGLPNESGMDFIPTSDLTRNTWYRATISRNVASVAGINMDADYIWIFRTRDSTEPCALAGINVAPSENTLSDVWKPTDGPQEKNITYSNYLASPHAANCNALRCNTYGWDWETDKPNSVQLIGDVVNGQNYCTAVARALAETPSGDPAKIDATASVLNGTKILGIGTGLLTVKFTDPRVESYWPNCEKACLEAEVGAKFNTAMDAASISAGNVKIFSCSDETCQTAVDLGAIVNYDSAAKTLTFPSISLLANGFYLVRITDTVRSTAGVQLTGTNSFWNGSPVFAWIFRVGTEHCQIASVSVNPPLVSTNVVGEYDSLSAVPMTQADDCSPSGERVNPYAISDWRWSINPDPTQNPPPASYGAELLGNGALNVKPLASVYATSSCLNTGTIQSHPVCGNSRVEDGRGAQKSVTSIKGKGTGGEQCDLGATNDSASTPTDGSTGSGCSANCLLTGAGVRQCANGATGCCGDGTVQGVCQPDLTGFSSGGRACTGNTDCQSGYVCRFDVPGAEQCDVGSKNGQADSGCSNRCLSLGSHSIVPTTTCGNNDLAFNEQCEDGNASSGDGCSSDCRDEGSTVGLSVCGNSLKDNGEDCDLGSQNGRPGSGCSATCLHTGSKTCSKTTDSGCCGNSVSEPAVGEDNGCDLGMDANGRLSVAPGCDLSCKKIGASLSYPTPSLCADNGATTTGKTFDPGPFDTSVDPTQYSHTVGRGNPDPSDKTFTSIVTARTGAVSGTATVKLQCGYTADNQCPAGRYVGYNSCCYAAPTVTGFTPPNDPNVNNPALARRVCRNPQIRVAFDRLIDQKTIVGNIVVAKANASGPCPEGSSQVRAGWRGYVDRFVAMLGQVWSLVLGRPAAAQVYCSAAGSVALVTVPNIGVGDPYSVATLSLSRALDPNAKYEIKVLGKAGNIAHIRSADGVALGSNAISYFMTGSDICTLDEVLVNTDPLALENMDTYLFSDFTKITDTFNAIPVHNERGVIEQIAPLPGVYDWSWQWGATDPTTGAASNLVGVTDTTTPTGTAETVSVIDPKKTGDAAVIPTATITADTLLNPSTVGSKVAGESIVTVMICTAPWPRGSGANWAPWPLANADGSRNGLPNNKYNFSFYYCRDAEEGTLPELGNPVMTDNPSPDFLRQYLLTYPSDPTLRSEGIGIRIAKNPGWLSPTAYYSSRGFVGTPSPLKIAGYNAVADGRTVYVNAANYDSSVSRIYPNMYIFSYSQGAGAATQNIFDQIKNNLKFNTNLAGLDAPICTGNNCTTARAQYARDVNRFEDMSSIAKAAVVVKAKSGAYPALSSGSYLAGRSYTPWPSWKNEFASELGASPPNDPLDTMGTCTEAGYDPATCWNGATKQFFCPRDAHIYGYNTDQYVAGFGLTMTTEQNQGSYYVCGYSDAASCTADPLCVVLPSGTCSSRINFTATCSNLHFGSGASVCGNGTIESGEDCETNQTRTATCGGTNTFAVSTCDQTCHWQAGTCQAVRCGNAIREGFCMSGGTRAGICQKNSDCASGYSCSYVEACDEGAANGQYGHCNASCTAFGARCGDGNQNPGEVCDSGTANGQYGSNCSLDCKKASGPTCGDGAVDPVGGEECDGNSETTASGCAKDPGTDIQMVRTRNCYPVNAPSQCRWEAYGACAIPTGAGCDNGVREGFEQCDDGNKLDTDGCLSNCKLPVCGDAFIRAGAEQCDNGNGNISPSDTTRINSLSAACLASTCSYCTTACSVGYVSGGYCGDGTVNESLGEQCEIGYTDTGVCTINGHNGTRNLTCSADCKVISGECIPSDYCGDGIVNGDEKCDGNPGCTSTCTCESQTIVSDGSLRVFDTNGTDLGSAVVQSSDFTGNYYWPQIAGASYVWSFDERNAAHPLAANWGTVDNTFIFEKTFTLPNPVTNAVMELGADNYVSKVELDGNDITSTVEGGGPINNYGVTFRFNLTDRLRNGGNHVLRITAADDSHADAPTPTSNPAILIFKITVIPDCTQVAQIPASSNVTVVSDTSDRIVSITNPAPLSSNPAPTSLPVNAVLIYRPEDSWSTWLQYRDTPTMSGANWIWYSSNQDTYAGCTSLAEGEIVHFTKTVDLPCPPTSVDFYIMADDDVRIDVNGHQDVCRNQIGYCPAGTCQVNQTVNHCSDVSTLVSGTNTLDFYVNNYCTNGGFVYKAVFNTNCG